MEHYERLLRGASAGITEGFAWTVVRPVSGHLSLEETATRITGGGRASITELDPEEAVYRDTILLNQLGTTTMLVQVQSSNYASAPQVLQWLSQNAQVWNVTWDIGRHFRLTYAAHGHVLAEISGSEPDTIVGSDSAALRVEMAALDLTIGRPWPATQATAMAIMESRTGAHLNEDWFYQAQPAVIIDKPISSEMPPVGFWHHEPDLDARIRLAPEHIRRAVLMRAVHEMAIRFEHDTVPEVTEALEAAHEGRSFGDAAVIAMTAVHESLGAYWDGQFNAEREHGDWQWSRWVAANAIRHGLQSLGEDARCLDGLTYARAALSENWPAFKERLRELATVNIGTEPQDRPSA
ncbi:hypothetical protein [Nonomuraea endophytica]|uniref:hypothetical protein n=1 Tax=Nonomuraea endophytica TaxID=714136 RepID=UPI0037C8D1D2